MAERKLQKSHESKRPVEHILTIQVKNAQPELASYIKKRVCHSLVTYAIEKGIIKRPKECSVCGKKRNHFCCPLAHHTDYTKPLLIVWLCSGCHAKAHTNDFQSSSTRERLRKLDKVFNFNYVVEEKNSMEDFINDYSNSSYDKPLKVPTT